jgi:hypothetical protein
MTLPMIVAGPVAAPITAMAMKILHAARRTAGTTSCI